MSCAWVPRSTISPPSSTRIWSALRMVESRCAITNVVRPRRSERRPSWIIASLSESRLAVAAAEPHAALADDRVVALLEAVDELVAVGDVAHLADLVERGLGA